MEPQDFINKVAKQVMVFIGQKGDPLSRQINEKENRRGGMAFTPPAEIPPEVKAIHKLFQEAFKTLYFANGKVENDKGGDFQKVAEAVMNVIKDTKPRKSSGMGSTLSVGGMVNQKLDSAFNELIKLRDEFKKSTPKEERAAESKPPTLGS